MGFKFITFFNLSNIHIWQDNNAIYLHPQNWLQLMSRLMELEYWVHIDICYVMIVNPNYTYFAREMIMLTDLSQLKTTFKAIIGLWRTQLCDTNNYTFVIDDGLEACTNNKRVYLQCSGLESNWVTYTLSNFKWNWSIGLPIFMIHKGEHIMFRNYSKFQWCIWIWAQLLFYTNTADWFSPDVSALLESMCLSMDIWVRMERTLRRDTIPKTIPKICYNDNISCSYHLYPQSCEEFIPVEGKLLSLFIQWGKVKILLSSACRRMCK